MINVKSGNPLRIINTKPAKGKAKELLEEEAAKAAATNRWKHWAKHSDEQHSTSN